MPNILVKSILSSICVIYRKHYILYRPTKMSDEPRRIKRSIITKVNLESGGYPMSMNRRQFLQVSAGIGAGFVLGNSLPAYGTIPACGNTAPEKDLNPYLSGHRIIDAHAHPSLFHLGNSPHYRDDSSTVEQLCEFGVEASVFAAVGDYVACCGGMMHLGDDFNATAYQLSNIANFLNNVTIIDRFPDIPNYSANGVKPGALMAIEGGQALMGDPDNVNYFHQHHYVRMITLVHYTPNNHPDSLGDQMTDNEVHGGLSSLGLQVLERMIQLNMVIDVAHTSTKTLLEVCAIAQSAGVPVIDSHTSLLRDYYSLPSSGFTRMRSLAEMEAVSNTGGVVCTWPLRCDSSCAGERARIEGWAAEIEYMIAHLGPDHVGLGSDGGGRLPGLVDGYQNIKNLNGLAYELAGRGLSYADIHAYMGANMLRVLNQVLL